MLLNGESLYKEGKCIFPFKDPISEETYYDCIPHSLDKNKGTICATEVDANGVMTKQGFCEGVKPESTFDDEFEEKTENYLVLTGSGKNKRNLATRKFFFPTFK